MVISFPDSHGHFHLTGYTEDNDTVQVDILVLEPDMTLDCGLATAKGVISWISGNVKVNGAPLNRNNFIFNITVGIRIVIQTTGPRKAAVRVEHQITPFQPSEKIVNL